MPSVKPQSRFSRFARSISHLTGRPIASILAIGIVLAWLASGPLFGFGNSWQLVINTTTTVVTFLMVFLIQNTQNRDAEAAQVKLDELIRVTAGAHTALLDLEELEQEDLDRIRAEYARLARRARAGLRKGTPDTGAPEL